MSWGRSRSDRRGNIGYDSPKIQGCAVPVVWLIADNLVYFSDTKQKPAVQTWPSEKIDSFHEKALADSIVRRSF